MLGIPICRRISSGEGIPGVGVTPGFIAFLRSASLGMPGVGVTPFGILAITAGIPGVDAFEVGNGLVESPGGIFAGSIVIIVFVLVFALPFAEFAGTVPPQPKDKAAPKPMVEIIKFLNIICASII